MPQKCRVAAAAIARAFASHEAHSVTRELANGGARDPSAGVTVSALFL